MLPAQNAYSSDREVYFDESLSFQPANSLTDFRQRANSVAPAEPRTLSDLPD